MFFDIGGTELLVIVVVTIIVVGPKDLPKLLRTVGHFVSKGRRMAGEFQTQFNAALREAEREVDLEDTRKTLQSVKSLNPVTAVKEEIAKAVEPVRDIGRSIQADPAFSSASARETPPAPVPAPTAAAPEPGLQPAPMPLVDDPAAAPQPSEPIKQGPVAPAARAPGQGEGA